MAPVRTLVTVYIGLMVLLALTAGSHAFPLGSWNAVINLGIAAAKTVLIALFFMNLRHETTLVRILSGVGIFWLSILFTLTLADYLHRSPGG
jgi:cytochrome c oxidase subunit 4